jgi:exopolysaccharide biosynthesis polyprenyl glycosylphosphotransferase
MFRRFSANYAIFSMILDGSLAGFALIIACATRPLYNGLPGVEFIQFPVDLPTPIYTLFPLMWVAVLLIFAVYDGRRNFRVVDEFANLTTGSFLAAVAMAGVLYFGYRDMSRVIFIVFLAQTYLLMIFWRSAARLVFRFRLGGLVQDRRVLILGTTEGGQRLADLVRSETGLGLILAGFLDDAPQSDPAHPLLGTLADLRQVVKGQRIDDVVVALPRSAYERLNWAVSELHDLPVKVWIIPDYYSLALHRATVEEFAGISMLDLRAPALTEYQRLVKRAFDLVVFLFAMPFFLPVMGVIALAIRLTSPGPIFYYAKRAGENGRIFGMIKFRTMVQNADQLQHLVEQRDEQGNLIHKRRDDPRVTPIGRFLRRTSLDELPQLFNVFKGEMSLVGPRPEMPHLVEQYQPWQRKRFAVPQGMTGWWQIHGRSDKPMHLHTEEDLYYVQHYSIWLDLQILFQTAWVVIRGKGAY